MRFPWHRPSSHATAAFLAWFACSALYLWTANGVAIRDDDRTNAWHHYEYLVDGFLQGHLHLSIEPSKELLALPDPTDPQQNRAYRLWDASLYQGKYYLYYGPSPALLLMLPWKAVTGHHLPQRLATGVFAATGLGALALLLAGLRRRFSPSASPVLLFWAIVLTGHLAWLPVILRRPAFWELPIVTAAALFWWSVYFLWRYHESGGLRGWAVAGGVALAFLLGARPTYLFTAGFVALLFTLPWVQGESLGDRLRRFLPAGVPLALGIGGLLAYNYARFGSPFEFGQSYQLWGIDERSVRHFSTAFIPFNAWCYLFSLPDVGPYFPFFHPAWTFDAPRDYIATEEVYGLLFSTPAQALGLAAAWEAWRSRADLGRRSLRIVIAASAVASLLTGAVLFCFAGACSRYVVELAAGGSVVAGAGMLALCSSRGSLISGVLRLLAIVAAAWSVTCVWLASYEFRGFARITQPVVYRTVARILNYPSYWAASRDNMAFGPVALEIRLAEKPTNDSAILLAAGSQSMMNRLIIDRVAPGQVKLRLTVNDLVIVETPTVACHGPAFHMVCEAPWLYPPAAHPFWDSFTDPSERQLRQTTFAIEVGGIRHARQTIWGFDATRLEPWVRTEAAQSHSCAWVERILGLEPPGRQ